MERVEVMLTDRGEIEVPESLRPQFEDEAKGAGVAFRLARRVSVGGNVLAVAEEDREAFEEEARGTGTAWEPVHTVRAGERTVQVPQSLSGEFLKEYRETPEFADERKAAALATAQRIGKRAAESYGGRVLPTLDEASAGAANMWRGLVSAPLTLADKALAGSGFVTRAVEAAYGEEGTSGFREAVEGARTRLEAWREKNLGYRDEQGREPGPEDWGVTFGGQIANTVAEVYLAAGAGRMAGAGRLKAEGGILKALKPGPLSVLYGLSRGEQTAAAAQEKGRSKLEQAGLGAVTGAWEAAVESVSQVLGLQESARAAVGGAVARGMRRAALSMLGEGAEEGAQSAGGAAVDKLAGLDERTWMKIGQDAAVEAAMGFAAAGVSEAGMGISAFSGERAQLRDALAGSAGSAEEAERAAAGAAGAAGTGGDFNAETQGRGGADGGGGDFNAGTQGRGEGRGTDEGTGAAGAAGAQPAAGGAYPGGAAAAEAAASAAAAQGLKMMPAREDGAVPEAVEERVAAGGRKVRGVRMLMPGGTREWDPDPALVALAEYWARDRMLFPPAPAGDRGRQAGDPRVIAERRLGWDPKPGKSVLVRVGRSAKLYPATVVETLDGQTVRVKIGKNVRSVKNGRAGYADLDVRQIQQWAGAEKTQKINEELARLPEGERRLVKESARRFKELLLEGDELVDQEGLVAADSVGGRAGGVMRTEELRRAYARAGAMLGIGGELNDPISQARALPALEAWLEEQRGGAAALTPEMWEEEFAAEAARERDVLEGEAFTLDSMTPEELEADRQRVAGARERVAQRRELERRAAARIEGSAGDMTGTLPGMEGTSDVPLFTEGGRDFNAEAQRRGDRDVLANVEDGGTAYGNRGAKKDGVTSVGGVRVTPHKVYNTDASAGMEGEGRTAAPVADGLQGVGMDLRDAVSLYRELRGMLPRIRKGLNGRALGWYKTAGREIELLASIFGLVDGADTARMRADLAARGLTPEEVEAQMPAEVNALVEIRRNRRVKMPVKVLTHELGHLIDALPDDAVRGRGNILGHIAALNGYLKQALPRAPGEPGEVTAEERRRLWADAERLAEREIGPAREWVEEIKREVKELERLPVTPDDIRGLLGTDGRERTPELYLWFARQDAATKKDVLRRAMRGLVDERAEGGAVREITRVVVTGTRIHKEQAYSRADVSKRYRELLRKAVADLMLIERKAVVAEAKAAIPKWRGADAWEKYFERPEEMYAELFGMFLSDPGFMERECPTAFRAYAAYMDARPEAARAYRQWLNDKQNGTVERKHVDRLKEAWAARAEDDLATLKHLSGKPTKAQEWQGLRYYLDRRFGPVYTAARAAQRLARRDIDERVKAGTLDEPAALALRERLDRRAGEITAGVKDVLHHQNTIRLMLLDVAGRVSRPLKAAGLDWTQLAEYAFHNRVRYELDGRAAAFGWMPETSGRRLDEMRAEMTPEQWSALEGAWKEFRGIYERSVVEMDGLRGMLGDALHDLIRENVHYVAFAHVPSPEEVSMSLAERAAAAKDAEKAGKGARSGETAFDIVAAELERRAGTLGAKIYPLTGSFDPVADPLSATLEKAGRLVAAVYKNRLKMQLRDFLRDAGYPGYREAETGERAGGEKFIREVNDGKFKTLHYMEGGEVKAFLVDHFIGEAFDGENFAKLNTFRRVLKVNNLISAMYTRLRIGFFEPAYAKDKQAAAANVKGLWRSPLASIPGVGDWGPGMITRYIPESVRDLLPRWLMNEHMLEYYEAQARRVAVLIERGDFEASLRRAEEIEAGGNRRAAERLRGDVYYARRALGMNVLMAMQDVILPGQGLGDYDRMNAKYGVKGETLREAERFIASKGRALATAFVEWYARLGEIRENTTKIATLMYLDKTTGQSDEQKKVTVSEFGGSPDFSERGVAAGYFEFMQGAFLNARKEGIARSWRAALDNPGEYAIKKMAYTVTPAALRWMVGSGFLLAAMKAAIPDDDERERNAVWQALVWMRQKMSHVSDYLQKSYACIPLPVDAGDGCAVILSLPMDETERAFSDLVYSALDSLTESLGEDVSKDPDPWLNYGGRILRDFIPASGSGGPLAGAVAPWLNTYALGKPTFDTFRQRNVLTDDELAARFSSPDAVMALLGNTWNALGGGTVKAWQRSGPQDTQKMVPVEEFLKWPVVQPVIGRFIRVVRGGQNQLASTISADLEKQKITDRLDARRIVDESAKAGAVVLPEYRERVFASTPYMLDYYFELYQKRYGKVKTDAFLELAAKIEDPATVMRLMKKRRELGY